MHIDITPGQAAFFWSHVSKSSDDACWEWQRCKSHKYGITVFGPQLGCWPRLRILTHRYAYAWAHGGNIPDGLCVLHKCDNKPCCNPAHLYAGTKSDNMHDAHARGQHAGYYPLKVDTSGPNSWCKRKPHLIRRGSKTSTPKLNEEQVLIIRARWAAGEQGKDLATEFGVSRSVISVVVNRKTWTHI